MGNWFRSIGTKVQAWWQGKQDPETILQQALWKIEENLIEIKRAVAQSIALQKRTQRYLSTYQHKAEQWRNRAEILVSRGEEDLARSALSRSNTYCTQAKNLSQQIQQQEGLVTHLQQDIHLLEKEYSDLLQKRESYYQRFHLARTRQKVQEELNDTRIGNARQLLDQLEETMIRLEAETTVMENYTLDPLEQKFRDLDS